MSIRRVIGLGSRALGVAVGVAALLTIGATPAGAVEDLYDCPDFTYQEEAQAILDADPTSLRTSREGTAGADSRASARPAGAGIVVMPRPTPPGSDGD